LGGKDEIVDSRFCQVHLSTNIIFASAIGLAGCGKFHSKDLDPNDVSSSTLSSTKVTLTEPAYQNTVYAYVNSVGCNTCHANGPAPNNFWYASSNLVPPFKLPFPWLTQPIRRTRYLLYKSPTITAAFPRFAASPTPT